MFTMTLQGHLGTSLESRSTFSRTMERRNGSVRSAPNTMQFNQIGKLVQNLWHQGIHNVIVVLFSLDNSV